MKKLKTEINVLKENVVERLFKTNPIKNDQKQKLFTSLGQFENKSNHSSKIFDDFYLLEEKKLCSFFSSNDELIRSFAVRAYIDKAPSNLSLTLSKMLQDNNELIRHSAVIGLAYLNLQENLDLLKVALGDKSDAIKLTSLTGIADIAHEYNCKEAIEILKTFSNSSNKQIKQFVEDELSLLFD